MRKIISFFGALALTLGCATPVTACFKLVSNPAKDLIQKINNIILQLPLNTPRSNLAQAIPIIREALVKTGKITNAEAKQLTFTGSLLPDDKQIRLKVVAKVSGQTAAGQIFIKQSINAQDLIAKIQGAKIDVPVGTNIKVSNLQTQTLIRNALEAAKGLTPQEASALSFSGPDLSLGVPVNVIATVTGTAPIVRTTVEVKLLTKAQAVIKAIASTIITVPFGTNPDVRDAATANALSNALKKVNPALKRITWSYTLSYTGPTLVTAQAIQIEVTAAAASHVASKNITVTLERQDEGDAPRPTITSLNGYQKPRGVTPTIDNRSLYKQLNPQSTVGAAWRSRIKEKLPDPYNANNQKFVQSIENIGYLKNIVRNQEITNYQNLAQLNNVGFNNFDSLVTWLKPTAYASSNIELNDIATSIAAGLKTEYNWDDTKALAEAKTGLVRFYAMLVHMVGSQNIIKNLVSKLVINPKPPGSSAIGGTIFNPSIDQQYIEFYGSNFASYALSDQQYQIGYWSTNSPFHVLIHEYGHALQNYYWLARASRSVLNSGVTGQPLYINRLNLSGNDYLPMFLNNNFFANEGTITKSQVTQQIPQLITYAVVPSGYARTGKYATRTADTGYYAESFAESFALWFNPYIKAFLNATNPQQTVTLQAIKTRASVNWALINAYYNPHYGGPNLTTNDFVDHFAPL